MPPDTYDPSITSTKRSITGKKPEISDQKLAANRANAQLSTGPRTEEGKSRSSLNAVKTGLTGRTVLLPGDDAALYEAHFAAFLAHYKPIGDRETDIVQNLADTQWRLNRIPGLESGILALHRRQLLEDFADQPAEIRETLLEAAAQVAAQKHLTNLHLQESRLRKRLAQDLALLEDTRHEREQAEISINCQQAADWVEQGRQRRRRDYQRRYKKGLATRLARQRAAASAQSSGKTGFEFSNSPTSSHPALEPAA